MPGPRALGLAGILGVGVALYLALFTGLPGFIAVGIGATMAVILLLFAASLAGDPEEADAAWRAAAPDLARRERADPATEPAADAWPSPDEPSA